MTEPRRHPSLAAALIVVSLLAQTFLAASPVAAEQNPPIDITKLDMVPIEGWGVSGSSRDQTQTPSIKALVWDFAQVGDRMFVGGGFLNVQESKLATPIPQPFIAAFDLKTGDWIDTWRPELDRIVYTLEVFEGRLIVGGEFQTVNGQPREGLVALDPITGEIDQTFGTSVKRIWTDLRPMVRGLHADGTDLYVVGKFSHSLGPDGVLRRSYSALRLRSAAGDVDTKWQPKVTGSSVWAVTNDPARGEVHLTGFFTSVNGQPDSGYYHTVNGTTGASVPGLLPIPRNYPPQPQLFDVAVGDGILFVAGEQHLMEVLDPATHSMLGFHHTGYANDGFAYTGRFAGGAFQVAERIGDLVFAGCHCTFSQLNGVMSHYSSFSGRTPNRLAMAYNATTGDIVPEFMPDIHSPKEGIWAIATDTNGCIWLGGDLHVGGVDHGKSRWLGGFGRLCELGYDPGALPVPDPDPSVLLAAGSTWKFDDSGRDLGTAWSTPTFNDGAWSQGKGEFGFGEKNLGTVLKSGFVTYYFRTTFDAAAPLPTSLTLKLKDDDGAIVYLNGTELVRDNLPDGLVGASVPASGWKGGPDEKYQAYVVPADSLVAGTNVVAVEVHNVWSGNSDLNFDLELARSTEVVAPVAVTDLIKINSEWNHTTSANGSAPAGWPTALSNEPTVRAEAGFGDNDEVTVLPPGQETYYFSTTFPVDNVADWGPDLTLDLVVDDGAVVYLNGTELLRRNMPDGPIRWNTRPANWVSGPDELLQSFTVPADGLRAGDNVLAVEVHNFWPGNNDLSFDLALRD